MKNIIWLLLPLSLFFQQCTSQTPKINAVEVQQLLASKNFTFMATRAIPSASDINNIIVNMPNRNSQRILELSHGYTVKIEDGMLSVDLPYFGRVFHPTYGTDNQGIKFSSTDFTITEQADAKGKTTFIIKPKDVTRVNIMYLDIYKNGTAYLSVNSIDRQPISYNGYIMSNTASTK